MVEEWQIATLAEKIPPQVLKQGSQFLAKVLSEKASGLKMESDFGNQGQWLQVRARGEDADAFLNLLKQEYGEAPVSHSSLEKWDAVRGFVAGAGRIGYGVYFDIGVQDPRPKDALYPLHRMRAQLADGEPKSAREILDANALVDFVPLQMIVTELEGENISVELNDQARDSLVSWRKYPFDRVIVVGADVDFVENAVRASGLESDIVAVESLSVFVQSVLCKIGTEAPGVIAKIGNRLRGVSLKSYRTHIKL
ncbi:MAG TPA: DUF2110 family protein [Candidatus Bathyarchaeia archaeon]|nr:DUF2110 family protein [Candidatus Bathyarchaeia archaeon]